MLNEICLEHFKCFEKLCLPLNRLTLLTGTNASGKSTVLQSLVLLHQTAKDSEWSTRLLLNGSEINLGSASDVIDKETGRMSFGIGLVDDGNNFHWDFEVSDRKNDMSAAVKVVRLNNAKETDPERLQFLFPIEHRTQKADTLAKHLLQLTYLTAERLGPREIYSSVDPSFHQVVGPRGEDALSVLHWNRSRTILKSLVISNAVPTLLKQTEAHMGVFFPGCSLDVQQVPQVNGVTLGLTTSSATGFHRPVHVGFGLTQVLPIVVASLSAEPDDILLIENPEVHLHPAGQSLMGIFLAKVASAGVQVIVETHSDHVLNGVRRAVREQLLESTSINIHYFRNREHVDSPVLSLLMDQKGNLDSWPDGFFDQFDKDMNHFAGWEE